MVKKKSRYTKHFSCPFYRTTKEGTFIFNDVFRWKCHYWIWRHKERSGGPFAKLKRGGGSKVQVKYVVQTRQQYRRFDTIDTIMCFVSACVCFVINNIGYTGLPTVLFKECSHSNTTGIEWTRHFDTQKWSGGLKFSREFICLPRTFSDWRTEKIVGKVTKRWWHLNSRKDFQQITWSLSGHWVSKQKFQH